MFRRAANSDDSRIILLCFSEASEELFITFAAMETGLNIEGFSQGIRSSPRQVVVLIYDFLAISKH